MADCEYDDEGYTFTVELSAIELGGYSNTFVRAMRDNNDNDGQMIVVFSSEENVNYFVNYDLLDPYTMESVTTTWTYADGTQPSTDALPADPAGAFAAYCIAVVDQDMNPIPGVMVNVCTDETCQPSFTDENGEVYFESEPYPYSIHILSVPQGYSIDLSKEYILNEAGDYLQIILK